MNDDKKQRLEADGFQIGSIAEFLELTPEEQSQIKNVIIRHGKPVGLCKCLGKGSDKCLGNGWVKVQNGHQRCPNMNFFK